MGIFKNLLPQKVRVLFRNLSLLCRLDLHRLLWQLTAMEKSIRGISALALTTSEDARSLFPEPIVHSVINTAEFRVYSQNGEDGILLWLFSKIGTTSKRFVEFGMGTGRECITTNLVLNFNWKGLLMDGSAENVADAKLYFKRLMPWDEYKELDIQRQFVTKENINTLLASVMKQGAFKGQPDLLVIDIDGNDLWVWKEIEIIEPRVVVIEYNATFGPEESITIPYSQNFNTYAEHPYGIYHGASLAALVKLGEQKGYVFIGAESHGANAFFVKKGLADELKTTPEKAWYDNQHHAKRGSLKERREFIKDKTFITI